MRSILLSLLAIVSLSSCSGGSDSPLVVSYSGKDGIFLLPGSTKSCYALAAAKAGGTTPADDVSSSYFQIPNFTLNWYGMDSSFQVFLISVRIQAQSLTGKVEEVSIGGNELLSLDGSAAGWNATLAAAKHTTDANGNLQPVLDSSGNPSPTSWTATCRPTFGGIAVQESAKKGTTYVSGEVTIIGKKIFSDLTEEPVTLRSSIVLINAGG